MADHPRRGVVVVEYHLIRVELIHRLIDVHQTLTGVHEQSKANRD